MYHILIQSRVFLDVIASDNFHLINPTDRLLSQRFFIKWLGNFMLEKFSFLLQRDIFGENYEYTLIYN